MRIVGVGAFFRLGKWYLIVSRRCRHQTPGVLREQLDLYHARHIKEHQCGGALPLRTCRWGTSKQDRWMVEDDVQHQLHISGECTPSGFMSQTADKA